ncbi:zinc finger protein [Macleaya cordata]|uniref:RING-type E3 ubiquitin transferase n=1 Tax=Macleaya cordata TaxID=56857 RepID=A0A200QVN9_MACCD|nr:zinc finger protein [Macleaya cordata]
MAKFSLGRDEEESEAGPSSHSESPKHKKQKTSKEEVPKEDDDNDHLVRSGREGISISSSSISVTLVDPEVLDCSICMEPLTPPIFQCENGHIACSPCCTKLGNKCPSCSWPIGYNRCRAIEKVIESIEVSCQHARYGCKETFSYKQKLTHEETCIYAPCTCPVSDCTFLGSSEQLYLHFSSKHWASARRFQYNCPFSVSFDKDDSFLVFQGEEDGRLFLLNNQIELIGNAISVTCIGPSSVMGGFSYDLISRRGRSSLRLQSFTKSVKGQMESSLFVDFLMVPYDFSRCFGQLKLEVCIWSSRELE